MSMIDLQQQSIQGNVSEETKTVKISGRTGGYLYHAIDDIQSLNAMIIWVLSVMWRMDFFQTRNLQETILKLNYLDFFQTRKNPDVIAHMKNNTSISCHVAHGLFSNKNSTRKNPEIKIFGFFPNKKKSGNCMKFLIWKTIWVFSVMWHMDFF